MPGFRFRINDPPEGPGAPRIHLFKLFLPAGALLLLFGLWTAYHYFQLKEPAESQLHEVRLQDVLKITETRSSNNTNEIRSINLETTDGHAIYYNAFWPNFEEVHARHTNFSLLVDSTNQVWAVKSGDGSLLGRAYFKSRNTERKSLNGFCAVWFVPMGAFLLITYWAAERCLRTGGKLPPEAMMLVSVRKLVLFGSLLGYLFLFGLFIGPFLTTVMPVLLVGLIWVLSAGLLGNFVVRYFQKRGPPQ